MFVLIVILFFTFLNYSNTQTNNCSSVKSEIIWKSMLHAASYWQPSINEDLASLISTYIKEAACETLDCVLKSENLEVYNGIHLVKDKNSNNISITKNNLRAVALEEKIVNVLLNIGERYSLQIHLNKMVTNERAINEGRHRRRRHHMMPFMMFGIVGLSIILIPMGFKFLAVLGGKALLLAKMALILSSIQGLKKLATSNYNYGLYQTAPTNPWHYERYGYETIPDSQSELLPPAYIQY